jgi:hypothetical protein
VTGDTAVPYLPPETAVDALKDACAVVRCAAANDLEGLGAVINGNEHPRRLVMVIASVAAVICRRGGLDDAGIAALLAGIASELTDLLLDQEKPAEGGGSHR